MLFCSESLNFPGLGPGSPFGISSATTSQEAAAWTHVSSWTSWGPNRAMPPKNSFDGQTYPVDRYRPVDFAGYPGTLFSDYPICRYPCAIEVAGEQFQHVSTCFPHPITSFFLGVICAWVKITHHPFGTSRGPSGWFDVYTPSMTTFVGPLAIATPISTHESHFRRSAMSERKRLDGFQWSLRFPSH